MRKYIATAVFVTGLMAPTVAGADHDYGHYYLTPKEPNRYGLPPLGSFKPAPLEPEWQRRQRRNESYRWLLESDRDSMRGPGARDAGCKGTLMGYWNCAK